MLAPSFRGIGFLLAACLISYAVQLGNGAMAPQAAECVVASLALQLLLLAANFAPDRVRAWTARPSRVLFALGALATVTLVAVSLYVATQVRPAIYLAADASMPVFRVSLAIVALIACRMFLPARNALVGQKRTQAIALFGLALTGGLFLWTLRESPRPFIDVWYWQEHAMNLVDQGKNPWAAHMPNIYGSTQWFAKGRASASEVLTGYPYPPLTLAMGFAGHIFARDYRYAYAALILLALLAVGRARPKPLTFALLALFVLTPRLLFVLEQGWSEVPGVFLIGLLCLVWVRHRKALPYVLGLLISSKQYFIFAIPLSLLLFSPSWTEWKRLAIFYGKVAAVVLACNLPFLLLNPHAFYDSLVVFQSAQPFRPDALSLMAWTAKDGVPTMSGIYSWLWVVVIWCLALAKAPRTMSGFLGSLAFAMTGFFFLSKQAFCNYYFLVLWLLFIAAVMSPAQRFKKRIAPVS